MEGKKAMSVVDVGGRGGGGGSVKVLAGGDEALSEFQQKDLRRSSLIRVCISSLLSRCPANIAAWG